MSTEADRVADADRPAEPGGPPAAPAGAPWRRPWALDAAVCLAYLAIAFWLASALWPDPHSRALADNAADQTLYEWFLAHDTRLFTGDFGFLTHRLNSPDGVNLLANTSVIALGALFTPVTLLFGAPVTFAVIAVASLAGTAAAWYLLLARSLRLHRAAALAGGAFCGFAPGMVSQNNSHLHMTAQWLVPAMVWCVLKLYRGGRPWVGLLLGLLVSAQVFIGEEVLFLTAITLLLVAVGYAAAAPGEALRAAPRFLLGGAIAVLTALALLAYPLWFQFAGPQSVPNAPFSAEYYSADIVSYVTSSPLALFGSAQDARLATGAAEYNTFLGWPLLVLAAGLAIWLLSRRATRPVVAAIVFASVVMAAFSLGPRVVIDGRRTEQWAPFSLIVDAPVVSAALPQRFALALIPLLGTLLALALHRALAHPSVLVRSGVPVLVLVALLPVVPRPLDGIDRAPVPQFISQGHWRQCVAEKGVLVPVPLPTPPEPWPMRWAAAAEGRFGLPEGFFIAPYGADGNASMGTYKQPTSQLLADVAAGKGVPEIVPEQRDQALADVRFWRASCLVLADGEPYGPDLKTALEGLFGPGQRLADAWYWKVG
ncbi:hypothetical protein [Rhizomonospora bruguierae]|uniref:hypothetical protein n=1 Tax=Rhizomonospora bruguierae TaxID=1581705 RepID=UPI0020BF985D|nr:hypothetical protein [Micromonospora sp. NBRC 107566]